MKWEKSNESFSYIIRLRKWGGKNMMYYERWKKEEERGKKEEGKYVLKRNIH